MSTDMTKVNWLNRTIAAGPRLAIVTSQDQLTQALEDAGVENVEWDFKHPGCSCISFHHKFGDGLVCLIACNPEIMDTFDDGILVTASFVHEAVHVYQAYRKHITDFGIDMKIASSDDEFEAYAIQNITYILLEEYARLQQSIVSKMPTTSTVKKEPIKKGKATLQRGINLSETMQYEK